MANDWHIPALSEIEKALDTDLTEGLSAREARIRLEREIKKEKGNRRSLFVNPKSNPIKGFLSFAGAPFAVLLAVMAVLMVAISAFGNDKEGLLIGSSILAVWLATVIFGGILVCGAKSKLESMNEYASPMVKVRRGGNQFYTDGRNLVRGDVIILGAGDLLPCDARIIRSEGLTVEELYASDDGKICRRTLKKSENETYLADDGIKTPDAKNMLYAGTAITGGRALAVVCATDGEIYLLQHMEEGALGGRDVEPAAVKKLRPVMYKISFLAASALLILSLLGLLTLHGKESFICVFTMLLSAVAYLTVDLPVNGALVILSAYIKRLNSKKLSKNHRENFVAVRNVRAFDTLSGVTDLVLVGNAGLGEGICRFSSAYTPTGVLNALTPETAAGKRLLTLLHTYSKALRESNIENNFVENGYLDAITTHLRGCGFDINGAALALRSLYFANDGKRGVGYACAETESELYRTALFFSEELFSECKFIRDSHGVRAMFEDDIQNIKIFRANALKKGSKCLYVVTEDDGKQIFEGIVSLEQKSESELEDIIPELEKLNVKTTVFLGREGEQTARILSDPKLAKLFEGEIAYASEFIKEKRSIFDGVGEYCAYVGFTTDDYIKLISFMREKGSKIAAYGISNDYNGILASADIAISCDVMRYSGAKYRESVYEKIPPEGKETNIRCSQQTRLLSKVIIKRYSETGGGISSILRALKLARGAYVSAAHSVLLFITLMCSLLTFSAMSVLTGNMLIDPLQAAFLASVIAIFSITVFADADPKNEILTQQRDYTLYPAELIKENLLGIVIRVSVTLIFCIIIKVLDILKVFGEKPAYTLPIYICIVLTGFVEVFLANRKFTKKGEGRASCWLKVLLAYALLLALCAVSTQKPFVDVFFKNGIGEQEFLIVPAYVLLYIVAVWIKSMIMKKRKKH